MKVSIINEYKDNFKSYISSNTEMSNAFYFEVIRNWQSNWNLEKSNISETYDKSLQSKVSARLWGGSVNSPKSMMILLLNREEEFMRSTFRDLFNETLDIGLRLDRFAFHTDQVFRPLQSKNPKYVSHMHNDREILCLYLSLQYPEKYCLFNYPSFHKMMEIFQSRNIPTKVEVERYYKSCRGIKNLLCKDLELVTLIKERLQMDKEDEIGLMIMALFMEFVSGAN
jgi:hypothetical protein